MELLKKLALDISSLRYWELFVILQKSLKRVRVSHWPSMLATRALLRLTTLKKEVEEPLELQIYDQGSIMQTHVYSQ